MHFEILVEDASGKIALDNILPKILGQNGLNHSYTIHSYKGIGRLPKNLKGTTDPQKRILLDRLPKILRGYSKSLQNTQASVVVVVDLDDRDCKTFKQELLNILDTCYPKPNTLFRIAIEETEAWFLGDKDAILSAYPRTNKNRLRGYVQDSICSTWENLADAIYPGGSNNLKTLGWPYTGQTKCEWAKRIAPYLDVDKNNSKSFQVFRDGLRKLAGITV